MGRKGSRLIPFIINGLVQQKYPNLKYEHVPSQAFSLSLPQKSSTLERNCQYILKDWYKLTGREYRFNVDYTQGKQGMEAALRRSDFLLNIQSGRKKKLIYRILDDDEVLEKKLLKKALKKAKTSSLPEIDYAPSPESSGYGSGSDGADENYDIVNHALLNAFRHDHKYEYTFDDSLLKVENRIEDCPKVPENFLMDDGVQEIENYPVDCPQDLKNINCVNSHLQNETSFNKDFLPTQEWNTFILPERQIKNSVLGEAHLVPMKDISYVKDDGQVKDLLLEDIDFEQLLNDENLLQFDDSELEELCKLNAELPSYLDGYAVNKELPPDLDGYAANAELPPVLDGYAVKNNQSKQSVVDIVSYKTQIRKVYECRDRQDLPGMILLTCEPKFKEFCVSATCVDEPSSSTLIFDEETMKVMSSYLFDDIKYLPNDHILVFLKLKELVN